MYYDGMSFLNRTAFIVLLVGSIALVTMLALTKLGDKRPVEPAVSNVSEKPAPFDPKCGREHKNEAGQPFILDCI